MTISLTDYEFETAIQSLRARLDPVAGYALDYYWTEVIRGLTGCAKALRFAAHSVFWAADRTRDGGFDRRAPWPAEHPLTRAVRRLRSHPSWKQLEPYFDDKIVGIEEHHERSPLAWDLEATRAELIAWLRRVDAPAERSARLEEVSGGPFEPVYSWVKLLTALVILETFGAFDPAFTRRHALRGDWWLLQPVSPRLDHDQIAIQLGLTLVGYLPAGHVDVDGRVVMACFERTRRPFAERRDILADSKWVAGFEHVRWTLDQPPLSDSSFDLALRLEPFPSEGNDYAPYRHSTTLPRWPR